MSQATNRCARCERLSTLTFAGMALWLGLQCLWWTDGLLAQILLGVCALASAAAALRFRIQALIDPDE